MLLLNVSLLILGTATAFAAIGGETWRKDQVEFFRRLTTRGWISICCLILTLAIGVLKEFASQSENDSQKAQNEQLKGQARNQLEQIEALRAELKEANTAVVETKERLIKGEASAHETAKALQTHVYKRLSTYTSRTLSLVSEMMEDASDGWLPKTEKEFFSRRSVDLICRELNIDRPARISPPQAWASWFSQNVREYRGVLSSLLSAYGPQLDIELIKSLSAIEDSMLLTAVPQWVDLRRTNETIRKFLPPLLCYGHEGRFEALVEKDFDAFASLVTHMRIHANQLGLKPYGIPYPKKSPNIGKGRFPPEELSKWEKEQNLIPFK